MGLRADIETYFNANWATGTGGTEPNWHNADLGTGKGLPLCLMTENVSDPEPVAKSAGGTLYKYEQTCALEYHCTDRTDAEKKETETKRLVRAKSVTSGWWEIGPADYLEQQKFCILKIDVKEVKWA